MLTNPATGRGPDESADGESKLVSKLCAPKPSKSRLAPPEPPDPDADWLRQPPLDLVEEASMESFPASDPPSYTGSHM